MRRLRVDRRASPLAARTPVLSERDFAIVWVRRCPLELENGEFAIGNQFARD